MTGENEIIGGPDDTRPQSKWIPEDGRTYWKALGKRVRTQCCAHSKRKVSEVTGEKARCCAVPVKRRNVCRNHGGLSPQAGLDASNYQHGRYSRVMRDFGEDWRRGLRQSYIDAQGRKDLLDGADSVAAMDAILTRLWERFLEESDSPPWREEIQKRYRAMISAAGSGNKARLSEAMTSLGALIDEGTTEDQAMIRLFGLEERRTTTAARAAEVRIRAERSYTASQLGALFREFVTIIWTTIPHEHAKNLLDLLSQRMRMAGARELAETEM